MMMMMMMMISPVVTQKVIQYAILIVMYCVFVYELYVRYRLFSVVWSPRTQRSNPGGAMWHLWWTKWHWDISHGVCRLSPVSTAPSVLQSFFCHRPFVI